MKRTTMKLLGAGAVAAVVGSGVVWAADQSVDVSATVVKFCQINSAVGLSGTVGVLSSSIAASPTSSSVTLDPVAPTGIMNDFAFTFTGSATCNAPSKVTLTSLNAGLRNGVVVPVASGVFLDRIDYNAFANWGTAPAATLATNSFVSGPAISTPPRNQPTALSANFTVSVGAILNTSAPLLAGSYSDTLRITIDPQ